MRTLFFTLGLLLHFTSSVLAESLPVGTVLTFKKAMIFRGERCLVFSKGKRDEQASQFMPRCELCTEAGVEGYIQTEPGTKLTLQQAFDENRVKEGGVAKLYGEIFVRESQRKRKVKINISCYPGNLLGFFYKFSTQTVLQQFEEELGPLLERSIANKANSTQLGEAKLFPILNDKSDENP